MKKLFAEFFSCWLVFGGCGSAIFASQIAPADNGQLGILLLGVSLAFGLTVLTMAYAVGHISGGTLILQFLLDFLLAVDFQLKI
jgi:aquaporin Z